MDTDGALVIDLRRPDWAEGADSLVTRLTSDPPKSIRFEANDAAAPSAEQAQLVLALTKFAASADVPITVEGIADEFNAGLERIGLTSVFPAEGDAAT